MNALDLREARVDEAAQLSALAVRSKAAWGYSEDFLLACRAELELAPATVKAGLSFVAEERGSATPLGFGSLDPIDGRVVDLLHLFVEPRAFRRGVGRALVSHATALAREMGRRVMTIQADPNAALFYEALGARRVGELESDSIAGRMLPLFELRL